MFFFRDIMEALSLLYWIGFSVALSWVEKGALQ